MAPTSSPTPRPTPPPRMPWTRRSPDGWPAGWSSAPRAEHRVSHTPLTGAPLASLPLSTPRGRRRRRRRRPRRPARLVAARRWSCASGSSCATTTSSSSGRSSCSTSSSSSPARPARHAFEEVADVALVARHYARSRRGIPAAARAGPGCSRCSPRARRAPPRPRASSASSRRGTTRSSLAITDAIPALMAGNAVVLRPDLQASLTALAGRRSCSPRPGCPRSVLQVVLGDGPDGRARRSSTSPTTSASPARPPPGGGSPSRSAGRLVGYSPRARRQELDVRRGRRRPRQGRRGRRAGLLLLGRPAVHLDRAAARARRRWPTSSPERFVDGRRGDAAGRRRCDYGADMGSLVSAAAARAGHRATSTTPRAKGARVLAGGRARPDIGPLLLRAHRPRGRHRRRWRCRDEETFGPVVSIYRVHSDDEAVRLANDTDYGLNAARLDPRRARAAAGIADRDPGRHRQHQRGVRRGLGQRRRPDGRDEAVRASAAGTAARASSSTPSRRTSRPSTSCRIAPVGGMSEETYARLLTGALGC